MMITVARKAEPGAIKNKQAQMLRGKPARIGDRTEANHNPSHCVAISEMKSTACLRVSSIIMSQIVAADETARTYPLAACCSGTRGHPVTSLSLRPIHRL